MANLWRALGRFIHKFSSKETPAHGTSHPKTPHPRPTVTLNLGFAPKLNHSCLSTYSHVQLAGRVSSPNGIFYLKI